MSRLKTAVTAEIADAISQLTNVDAITSEKIATTLIKSQADQWDSPSMQALLVDLMETEGVVSDNENSEDTDVKNFVDFWKKSKAKV